MSRIKALVFCLLAGFMFACNDNLEEFTNKVYLNSEVKRTSYLIDSDVTTLDATLSVGVPRPASEEIEVTFKVESSLLVNYVNTFGGEAELLPEQHYSIPDTKATIPQNSVRSTDVDVHFLDVNQLDADKTYVLPITIATATNVDILESRRTHYYIFKAGALINWAVDMEENYFKVDWADAAAVTGMKSITFESMVYVKGIVRDGSDSHIMTLFGVEGGFLIRLGDTFDPGQVQIVVGGGKYPDNANDRYKVPVGKWFHFAVTIDSGGALKIYQDGQLVSSTNIGSKTINLASKCHIGYSFNSNRWWNGMMCETRVWNKARTQEEIEASMYRVDSDSEGLIACWKFDEANGNTITDYSPNGNNIIANATLKWVSVELPEE